MPAEQIVGTITPDRPLLVVAVKEEAQFLPEGLPVLITGIGKVNATLALTTALTAARPQSLVNLGTAGALRPGLEGLHEVSTVLQHDLDTELLFQLTGETFGAPLDLDHDGEITLATGDTFVTGGPHKDVLAAQAHLVDMEGYAVAAVAQRLGLPVRLIKLVSDDADENSAKSWPETVSECARDLAGWVRAELP